MFERVKLVFGMTFILQQRYTIGLPARFQSILLVIRFKKQGLSDIYYPFNYTSFTFIVLANQCHYLTTFEIINVYIEFKSMKHFMKWKALVNQKETNDLTQHCVVDAKPVIWKYSNVYSQTKIIFLEIIKMISIWS